MGCVSGKSRNNL